MTGATRDNVERVVIFCLQGYHLLWLNFPKNSAKFDLCNSLAATRPLDAPTTPISQRLALTRYRFRLFPVRSPLLRKSSFLSTPEGT